MSKHNHAALAGHPTQEDWQTALNLRTCPPDKILFEENSQQLKRHLRTCYMCQINLDIQAEVSWTWPEVYQEIKPDPGPNPGQIRKIKPDLAGWGPGSRYYNPPLVLVLKQTDDQAVQVAQIFPGDEFMSEGDVYIQGFGFAQAWNIYTMGLKDLGGVLGKADADILETIFSKAGEYHETDEDSLLYLFQCMEIELGSFFSQQSIARILDKKPAPAEIVRSIARSINASEIAQAEDPVLELARMDFENLKQATAMYGHRPEQDNKVCVRITPGKMAAADADHVNARMISAHETGYEIQSGLVKIVSKSRTNHTLTIHGRTDPDFPFASEFQAWWETPEKTWTASELALSPDRQLFTAQFTGIDRKAVLEGRLVLIFFWIY